MRMVKKELEQLELTIRQNDLLSLVAQHATVWIEPQPLKLPNTPIPEIKTSVVPLHLGLDEGDIDVGGLLCHRVELG